MVTPGPGAEQNDRRLRGGFLGGSGYRQPNRVGVFPAMTSRPPGTG